MVSDVEESITTFKTQDVLPPNGKNANNNPLLFTAAYTAIHSIYCALTDFLNAPINAATDGHLRWLIPGCGHDHSQGIGHVHGVNCGHHHVPSPDMSRFEKVKEAAKQSFSKERFMQYAMGEFIGDFAAVPLTIGVQQAFPDFMNGVRKLTEPVMRPIFTFGAEQSTKRWANKHGVEQGSQEYSDHAAATITYEMYHFPQAVVWTGFSLGINTAYQMVADKSPIPFPQKLLLKGSSVLAGVLVTAGVVVTSRALMPNAMHSLDAWMGNNILLPTTKIVGKAFGVSEREVERMVKEGEEHAL